MALTYVNAAKKWWENNMKAKLKWFFKSFIWLFVLGLVIDIVSKAIIKTNMQEFDSITLIPHFLAITFSYNEAAAFGMGFANPEVNRWIYISVALIASGVILYFYVRKNKTYGKFLKACLMCILVGAIGNLIDRIIYGKVVDFIDFFGIWHAIFNVADSFVVVGAIMLIVYLIVEEVKDYKAKKALEPKVEGKVLSKTEQEKLEADQESDKVDN